MAIDVDSETNSGHLFQKQHTSHTCLLLPKFRSILCYTKEKEVAVPDVLWPSVLVQDHTIIENEHRHELCGWPLLFQRERRTST